MWLRWKLRESTYLIAKLEPDQADLPPPVHWIPDSSSLSLSLPEPFESVPLRANIAYPTVVDTPMAGWLSVLDRGPIIIHHHHPSSCAVSVVLCVAHCQSTALSITRTNVQSQSEDDLSHVRLSRSQLHVWGPGRRGAAREGGSEGD